MSARLNLNPIRNIEWKGRTFNQIVSRIKYNNPTEPPAEANIFRALPAKGYRREIGAPTNEANTRVSTTLDEVFGPGGANTTNASLSPGICQTLDINLTSDSTEIPKTISCSIRADDARRRVRSAGYAHNRYAYNASASQYLVNRNRTFAQSQYNHPTNESGIFTPNGINSCSTEDAHVKSYYKPSNQKFATQGGVSAGARLDRLKYDTIQSVAAKATAPFGAAVASSLSYKPSLMTNVRTYKDKKGYPRTPCQIQTPNLA